MDAATAQLLLMALLALVAVLVVALFLAGVLVWRALGGARPRAIRLKPDPGSDAALQARLHETETKALSAVAEGIRSTAAARGLVLDPAACQREARELLARTMGGE